MSAGQIKFDITQIKSSKGKIYFSLYRDKKNFDKVDEENFHIFLSIPAKKGKVSFVLPLAHGKFAPIVWHDENGNKKVDLSENQYPKEGMAFYKKKTLSTFPDFNKNSFNTLGLTAVKLKVIYP